MIGGKPLDLRDEALLLLEGGGELLNVAREVSQILRQSHIPGMVIGGVAVVLHGHIRTTKDVDIFLGEPPGRFAEAVLSCGYRWDAEQKAFWKNSVPIHLVLADQVRMLPSKAEEIENI